MRLRVQILILENARESLEDNGMKNSCPFIVRFVCIYCASFLLVGCSYLSEFSPSGFLSRFDDAQPVVETLEPVSSVVYGGGVPDIAQSVLSHTQGSVEIFDLDDPISVQAKQFGQPEPSDIAVEIQPDLSSRFIDIRPAESLAVPAVSMSEIPAQPVSVLSGDPSVEIFPFDDLMPIDDLMPMPMDGFASGFGAVDLVQQPHHLQKLQKPRRSYQPGRKEEFVSVATQDGNTVTVYFAHDSVTLNAQALQSLKDVSREFNFSAGRGLTVSGHASVRANYNNEKQRRLVNLRVSMSRAFAVAAALIKDGVPADAVRILAWGDAVPPRILNGKSLEAASRRVEISD